MSRLGLRFCFPWKLSGCQVQTADGDRRGRRALVSGCLVLNRGSLLKPYVQSFVLSQLSRVSFVALVHQKKCVIHDQWPHVQFYYWCYCCYNYYRTRASKIMAKRGQQSRAFVIVFICTFRSVLIKQSWHKTLDEFRNYSFSFRARLCSPSLSIPLTIQLHMIQLTSIDGWMLKCIVDELSVSRICSAHFYHCGMCLI